MSLGVNAGVTRIGSLLSRKFISMFQLLSSTAIANKIVSGTISHRNKNVLFFCPGFLISSEFYSSYMKLLNPTEIFIFSQIDNSTLTQEATALVNEVINNMTSDCNIILMGHSRGGAVVSIASCLLSERKINLYENIFTVLIDPVDTADQTALSFIRSSKAASLTKTLLISTPYGGSSGYYKVNYESSCAPNSRSSDAFFTAFDLKNNVDITYVILPNVGHLQLLDDGFSTASICASGKLSNSVVKSFIQTLLVSWFYSVEDKTYILSDLSFNHEMKKKLMSKLTLKFPGISKWTL